MKKLFLFVGMIFAINLGAQSQYEKGMNKAFELWNKGKLTESSNLFERIAKAEKENWIPFYYAAYLEIITSFKEKDEAKLKAKLEKASGHLDTGLLYSKDNAEILIIQALLNTSYIKFDGQKYGMSMTGKNEVLFKKAMKLAPNNPRVILQKAEWDMGTARFFGKPLDPYCKDIEKAIELFKKEKKSDVQYSPSWGKERAEKALRQCKKQKD